MIPIYCKVCNKNIGKSRFEYHIHYHHAKDEISTEDYLTQIRLFRKIDTFNLVD